MRVVQDWTEQLGLVLFEDEIQEQFWVEIPESPVQKIALIPENRNILTKYVETYLEKPLD